MATTHALVGVGLAVLVGALFPGSAAGTSLVPVAAAALGGLFPDFDLYAGHRRTLHFPVYFNVAAVIAAVVAAAATVVAPGSAVVITSVALFLAAAGVHSAMDAVGGGLELRPVETGVLLAVGVSAVYAVVRKPMVAATQAVVDALPQRVVDRLPARFVDDFR